MAQFYPLPGSTMSCRIERLAPLWLLGYHLVDLPLPACGPSSVQSAILWLAGMGPLEMYTAKSI